MSKTRELLEKLQSMFLRSESPMMDNSHRIDETKALKIIMLLYKECRQFESERTKLITACKSMSNFIIENGWSLPEELSEILKNIE